MRILIVENDAVTALDLEGMLVEAEYFVTGIAASANEALEIARRSPPALALLDIGIAGGVDGIELARGPQEDFSLARGYLTGSIEPAVPIRAIHTGPLGYIVKPFEDAELLSGIAVALCGSGLQCRGESNWDDPAPFGVDRTFPVFQPVRFAADVRPIELRCTPNRITAGRSDRDARAKPGMAARSSAVAPESEAAAVAASLRLT